MKQQEKNAKKIVDYLAGNSTVQNVFFPGLKNMGKEQVRIYKEQCLSGGAMVGFTIQDNEAIAFKFLNSLKLIKLAVSLGSNESLAQHPYSMTHADIPDEEKKSIGISEGLIRLSVGIENPDDIIADLQQALEQALNK